MPAHSPPIDSDGVAHFHKCAGDRGISKDIANCLIKSVSPSTLTAYRRYWKQFSVFFNEKGTRGQICINIICEFLLSLFSTGASSSSLNIARSALSLFLNYDLCLKENSTILRLFQYFYKERPTRPKYLTYWPVKDLLNYLSELHPPSILTLKQLTLKTLALVALSSSDRGQTIHAMNIEHTAMSEDGIQFIITNRLKHTRRVQKPKIIKCIVSDIPSLNVCDYVTYYMNKTFNIRAQHVAEGREKPTQLFLSWATKKPVTKQTLSRWLKLSLKDAGIDTQQFGGHSYRGAGLSHAVNKGASISQVVTAGCWTNTETFKRYYFAPENDSVVGKIIINSLV